MRQKPYKLDPHTFGGSPASESLASILNNNPRYVAKVSAYYHKFTEHLTNCLYSAQHFPNGTFNVMMELYKEHRFEHIRNSGMPDVIISHLLNVMTTSYKTNLRVVNRLMIEANNKRNST